MKIIDIKTTIVNAEMRNWVFVKIITDQDVYGWCEATVEWKTRAVVGAIEDLKPLLIGKDPRDIKQNFQIMTKHGFWKLGVIGMSAISGIEHALWDILGKSLNTPVWQLLGGKVRNKIKIYTHLGMGDMKAVYRDTMEKNKLNEHAAALIEKGYKAFKVVFIPFTHHTNSVKNLEKVNQLMTSLREEVGDDIDIMVDFHGRCASGISAIQYVKELQPYKPFFIEEPILPGETGIIKVNYDEKRVGSFNKSITITSNAKTTTKILKVKGKIIAADKNTGAPVKKQSKLVPKAN